jgi:hypothetical protein
MSDDPAPYVEKTAAPKRDAAPKARADTKKAQTPIRELMSFDALRESLKDKWTAIGIGVAYYNETDGLILIGGTDEFINSMVQLAERNVRVRRTLNRLANTGEGLSVLLPAANMAAAIASNHGAYNGPLLVSVASYVARAEDKVDLDGSIAPYDETLDDDLDAT